MYVPGTSPASRAGGMPKEVERERRRGPGFEKATARQPVSQTSGSVSQRAQRSMQCVFVCVRVLHCAPRRTRTPRCTLAGRTYRQLSGACSAEHMDSTRSVRVPAQKTTVGPDTHAWMYVYMYVHAYICIHVYMCVCMCVCVYVYVYGYGYVYVYAYVYVYVYIDAYIYAYV